ncbi:MAG: thioredoxin [Acidobacteria bacterium]|nr:thioredoxin [Acidobacteriota bacterium]
MAENILNVTDGSFENDVLKSDLPVLVDFWAEWCGPCRMLAPTVEDLARDYNGKLRVAKLNVDENIATPERYGIRGIPTLLLFKGGQVKDQIVGNYPRDHIEKVLQKHLS